MLCYLLTFDLTSAAKFDGSREFTFTNPHISHAKLKQMLLVIFLYKSIFSTRFVVFVLSVNAFIHCTDYRHWRTVKVFSSRTAATDRKRVSSGWIHAVFWLAAGKIWGHYSSGCSDYFPELFLSSVHTTFVLGFIKGKCASCCMVGWKYVCTYTFYKIMSRVYRNIVIAYEEIKKLKCG